MIGKPKRKSFVLVSIVMVFGLILSACGGNNGNNEASGSPSESASAPASESADAPASEAAAPSAADLDPYEISIYIPGNTTPDIPQVEDAINQYLKDKINATVKINFIDWNNYQNKTNLMLASGEEFDLFYTANWLGYNQQATKGEILPVDELIEKYGPDVKANLAPVYLEGAKVNGKLYGFPTNKEYASNVTFAIRKDIMDKYAFDPSSIVSYKDFGPWLKTIKEGEKDLTPMDGINAMESAVRAQFEMINGDYFGAFDWEKNDLKVVNVYEDPKFIDIIKTGREWYQAGYFLQDAATTQVTREEFMKNGKTAAFFIQSKPGLAAEKSVATGKDLVQVDFSKPVSGTGDVTGTFLAISSTSGNPERATMLANLLYSDKTLLNLIDWGIEGKHYAKVSDDIIDFPQGVDASNVGYSVQGDQWIFGNQFNSFLFKNEDPNKWANFKAFNDSAVVSKSLGFTFDPTPVQNEIAACKTVENQYFKGLLSGALDPDKYIKEYDSKMKSAGLDKIIAEKQKQIDAWAAANGM